MTSDSKTSAHKQYPTINYVLCSIHFDDVVIVNPTDIDHCSIEEGYTVPSRKEICNAYFKQTKHRISHR